jgi:diacylglycerol kinase (ATP)
MLVHILGNPAADGGRAAPHVDAVAQAVRDRGHQVVRLDAADAGAATRAARAAVAAGTDRLVLVGGDGLVHLAIQATACTPTAIGIVPVGSGNDFARGLGLDGTAIPPAVDRALSAVHTVDAIHTPTRWVASVATLGFSALVNARANALRRPRGSARSTVATLLELPKLRPVAITLDLDGTRHELEATFVAIANTALFGGGMAICPAASPHDGRLDVAVVGAIGRATLLRFFPREFKGTHVSHPAVTMLSARRIELHGADIAVRGDGEPIGVTPLTLEARPDALRIAGITTR